MKTSESISDVKDFYSYMGKALKIALGHNWHFGYWPEGGGKLSFEDAQDNMTSVVIENFPVKEGAKTLDVGCGMGMPAIALNKAKGCHVTGINIDSFQLEEATKLARERGINDQVKFIYGSGLEIPFENETFDGVWATESICHMKDGKQVIGEIFRVLKKGGYFVFTDMFEVIQLRPEHWDVLSELFGIVSIRPLKDYRNLLETTGFEVLKLENISKATQPNSMVMSKAISNNIPEITEEVGEDFEEAMDTSWKVMSACMKRSGYLLGSCRKPE